MSSVDIKIVSDLSQIGQQDWDACACPEAADGGRPFDPFTTYRFLKTLEDSGSVGPGTGWQPQHIAVSQAGQTIAVAPMYAKSHSQGEYIFDHSWAHAYERGGGRYYPKLQIAVPFTPVTGRRLLTRPGFEKIGLAALAQTAIEHASSNGLSSLHVTFCNAAERRQGEQMGFLSRTTQQFHWENSGYDSFDGFVQSLSSRKRKNIRKERAQAQGFGGEINHYSGDALRCAHWDAFWTFYQDTGARKWGTPYLTRRFFDLAQDRLRDDVHLILAERGGRPVAGALSLRGRETLFGRYWGCTEHHACLHFELCYYQSIDIAIRDNLKRIEAGAQGEHKLARGYLPKQTHSLHWIRDAGFSDAVARYLAEEKRAVAQDIQILSDYGPFKKINVEEHQ